VSPEKITVVLNGIDIARFRDARKKFVRRDFFNAWEVPENSLLVGTVGELTPLKGQEDFLRTAVQVLRQDPAAYFIIAGIDHSRGGEHRTRIEHLIAELNLGNRVKLVGWVPDLAQLYCALDVFVSASHTESFGLVLAEAMASGTAVVATETEGARELIQAEETGVLVPIGDSDKLATAILKLLKDNNSRSQLATNAQQAASEKFSVERMIAETERVYQEAKFLNSA
jgi:glycosyltransferase involved in cell wall biosynthesis